jgi:hypothetical protein
MEKLLLRASLLVSLSMPVAGFAQEIADVSKINDTSNISVADAASDRAWRLHFSTYVSGSRQGGGLSDSFATDSLAVCEHIAKNLTEVYEKTQMGSWTDNKSVALCINTHTGSIEVISH